MTPEALIDTDRWPLNDTALHEQLHRVFCAENVVVLPGFIRHEYIDELVRESEELMTVSYRSEVNGKVNVVAYDQFPAHSLLRALYEWDGLMNFVGKVLGEAKLFRYADELGALNLSSMIDGDDLGWHFDQTDFVVSIALQPSISGGEFKNAARIRSADNNNEDIVQAVRNGERPDLVRVEPMTPGTLMVFNGRWSLHQVSPIVGDVTRHVALLAYDTKPGTESNQELKFTRYGRMPA